MLTPASIVQLVHVALLEMLVAFRTPGLAVDVIPRLAGIEAFLQIYRSCRDPVNVPDLRYLRDCFFGHAVPSISLPYLGCYTGVFEPKIRKVSGGSFPPCV